MAATVQPVVLPDGTEIGRIEERDTEPGIFNGLLNGDDSASETVVNGVPENLARLAVVRHYLVREIEIQQEGDPLDADQSASRTAHIRSAFDMQKEITEEEWRLRGLELPARGVQ